MTKEKRKQHKQSKKQQDAEEKQQEDIEHLQKQVEQMRKEFDELQGEKDDLFSKLQRVSADYSNFQKRAPRQIAEAVAYEKEKFIKSLLPVLDNFEHVLQNAEKTDESDDIVKGVKIIYDHMLDVLKSHNVQQIQAVGEKFDPSLHQALMQKSEPEKEEEEVLAEFQKGYRIDTRVIRPSKVVVNKHEEEKSEEPEQHEEARENKDKKQDQDTKENDNKDQNRVNPEQDKDKETE